MSTSCPSSFALERYTSNVTSLAHQGAFAPLIGYETSIRQIFQILLRQTPHQYNPLFLDSDEQRRMRIVIEVARQMAAGNAPDPLSTWQVFALDYKSLFAHLPPFPESSFSENQWNRDTASREHQKRVGLIGEEDQIFSQIAERGNAAQVISSRLQDLFQDLRQQEEGVVLFVDHFHRLLGGEKQSYPVDIANLLVPALACREIRIIGTCTLAQYRIHVESLSAIARRFKEICLPS